MRNHKIAIIIILIGISFPIRAQFLEKLGKKAQKSAERTVERRVEKETEKKTDDALDEVLEGGNSNDNSGNSSNTNGGSNSGKSSSTSSNSNSTSANNSGNSSVSGSNNIVTGSSFFPNGDIIFQENFSRDAQGDFPVNWNTNAGGEIILVNQTKALKLYPNSLCIANTGELPQNYALEFDFTTANLAYKELSGAEFSVKFTNEKTLNNAARQRSEFRFSLWQGSSVADKIHVENYGTDYNLSNNINYKMNDIFNKTAHFTAVVNSRRLRVYIDNEKVIDLPTFLQNNVGRYVQFYLRGTQPTLDHIIAISNIKITEEGEDIRSLLLKGGFSTTKILFDSGSDQIRGESYSFLNKVGKALESDGSMKVMIIGHTDSDGDNQANLVLSQNRAASVKTYLVSNFNIPAGKLQTDGKGENQPVGDNSSPEGKAKNRRVEFKKL